MSSMSAPTLLMFFDRNRADHEWQKYMLLLYSPIGMVLFVLRIFLSIHFYITASLLPRQTAIRTFVLECLLFFLGIRIKKDTSKATPSDEAKVFLSNHISRFDFIPFHITLSCNSPNMPSLSFPFSCESLGLLNLGREPRMASFLSRLKNYLSKTNTPIVMFPEEATTSGKHGLLDFSPWPVSTCNCIQPVYISAQRPMTNASLSPVLSNWYSDLFWFFFTPMTVYTFKFLPIVKRLSNESDYAFVQRIQVLMSEDAHIINSNFTADDKDELERKIMRDLRTPPRQARPPRQYSSRVYNEAQRIQEILPHVPLTHIFRELSRSHQNSELTIARLIDTYPSPSANQVIQASMNQSLNQSSSSSSPTQFNSSPINRMSAFAEKKALFIEEARKRYILKHNLNVSS